MTNPLIRVVFLILLVLVCADTPGFAHPHVFIECAITLVFDDEGLTGFQQRWLLDEMFTAFLIEDFDANVNMKFEPEEIKVLKAGAFDNLREYQYFSHVMIDGETFVVQEVTSFSIEMSSGGRAIYSFFVPCPVKAGLDPRQVMIAIFDDTYYCDVTLVKDAMGAKNHEPFTLSPEIKDLPELIYYFDQVIPQGLECTFQKKT